MAIDFDSQRWERIKADSRKWWAGELNRPLIQMRIERDSGRREPAPWEFLPQYGDNVSAREIVDRWEYDLSTQKYMGDAFPAKWVNFGAGVLAALLGCRLSADERTVWFHPPRDLEVGQIELRFDPENQWFKRICDVMKAAGERLGGAAQIGMTDLGGTMDILSSFRPGERLLMDLVDAPDTVERLVWQAHELWHKYFLEFDAILRRFNPGWTCWTPIFSSQPYYMLQCDFCYMIGPEMFDRFVKPDLAACCRRLPHAFYHLDGIGELRHLDSILSIKELKGVQWIPGAGKPEAANWPEVIQKIRAAGKLVQFSGTMKAFDSLAEKIGSVEGICLMLQNSYPAEKEKQIEHFLLKYGAL